MSDFPTMACSAFGSDGPRDLILYSEHSEIIQYLHVLVE